MTDVLGAEADSGPELFAWGADLVAYLGLDRYREEVVEQALDSLARLEHHVAEWTRTARGAVPDAIRAALRLEATEQDAAAAFAQLLTGGVEPTRSALVTGAVSLTWPGHPEAFRRAPEGYVSEVLRVSSPFHFAPRTAGSDLVLRETRIPAGARVSVVLCAANTTPPGSRLPSTWTRGALSATTSPSATAATSARVPASRRRCCRRGWKPSWRPDSARRAHGSRPATCGPRA
ncbi:hypothetical protein [Streptomyces bacillaris]